MTCAYCTKRMTKQDHPVAGAIQVPIYPGSKPACGSAACQYAAWKDSKRG